MVILNSYEPLHLTGMKTTVSEAEHPLLCEGTRREKGDLALALMITYKDDQSKLKKVRDQGTGILTGIESRCHHFSWVSSRMRKVILLIEDKWGILETPRKEQERPVILTGVLGQECGKREAEGIKSVIHSLVSMLTG